MFTYHEKDNHKISNPAKMHLPIPLEVTQSQMFDMPEVRSTEVDPPPISYIKKAYPARLIRIYSNFLLRGYMERLPRRISY
jgi:hypothetical protein